MSSSSFAKPYPAMLATSSVSTRVSRREIYAFHTIDRILFARLVVDLCCNINHALQSMALWLWIERATFSSVIYTLLKFPDPKLHVLFQETLFSLNLMEDQLSITSSNFIELPVLQSIARRIRVSSRFFSHNRDKILSGVKRAFQDVCTRAFDDIIEQVSARQMFEAAAAANAGPSGHGLLDAFPYDAGFVTGFNPVPDAPRVDSFSPSMHAGTSAYPEQVMMYPTYPHAPFGLMHQPPVDEATEILRLVDQRMLETENQVHPDERTIFLTFSKGYPIREHEVREFFTSLYGDMVEEVLMQDVPIDEQALYAKLVLHHPSAISVVLGGQPKAKFSIDGRHVWARKYVNKIRLPVWSRTSRMFGRGFCTVSASYPVGLVPISCNGNYDAVQSTALHLRLDMHFAQI